MENHPSLSVIVPAYNEAARLEGSLATLTHYLRDREGSYEVLVVDDGSTDDSAAIAERHPDPATRLLRQPENRGKGAAVRRGVAGSSGDHVLLCDADLSTPIGELERLLGAYTPGAMVLGSRRNADSRLQRSFPRRVVSWVFNTLLHSLGLCRGLDDTQCGFKLIDGEVARRLFPRLELDGFAFDLELIELARLEGVPVREVGIEWNDSGESSVRPFRDGLAMLGDALTVRRRVRRLAARS